MTLVIAQRSRLLVLSVERQAGFGGLDLSFLLEYLLQWKTFPILRDNDNIKDPSIKETDVINIILFDAGALLNLMEV